MAVCYASTTFHSFMTDKTMKHILSYLLAIYILASCTQDNLPKTSGYGRLSVSPINISTEVELETKAANRAVDSRLQVDILQGSTIIRTYEAGSEALNSPIVLPVGHYTLIAHSPDMNEAANNVTGSATYSISRDFQIEADMVTTVDNLVAPQANIGISLQYQDDLFSTAFSSVTCTLYSPSTGRRVEITDINNKDFIYFNIPADGILQYSFNATNTDGEVFHSGIKNITATEAKNYLLLIAFD